MSEDTADETDEVVEQSASDEESDDGANPIIVYECSEKFVAMHEEVESDLLWQAVGDSQEEVVEDMIETLNYLPSQMQEVRDEQAELAAVVPLTRSDDDE